MYPMSATRRFAIWCGPDHEVIHRQPLGPLSIEPGGGGVVLALRAAAMAAGQHLVMGVTATITVLMAFATGAGTAGFDGAESLQVMRLQSLPVLRHQRRAAGGHDVGECGF